MNACAIAPDIVLRIARRAAYRVERFDREARRDVTQELAMRILADRSPDPARAVYVARAWALNHAQRRTRHSRSLEVFPDDIPRPGDLLRSLLADKLEGPEPQRSERGAWLHAFAPGETITSHRVAARFGVTVKRAGDWVRKAYQFRRVRRVSRGVYAKP